MASTVTRVTQGAWTDLGTGNQQVQALDFDIYVALGAAPPAASATGFLLTAGNEQPIMLMTTTGHVYVRAVTPYGANIVYAPTT